VIALLEILRTGIISFQFLINGDAGTLGVEPDTHAPVRVDRVLVTTFFNGPCAQIRAAVVEDDIGTSTNNNRSSSRSSADMDGIQCKRAVADIITYGSGRPEKEHRAAKLI
jgi:hypothetical protein